MKTVFKKGLPIVLGSLFLLLLILLMAGRSYVNDGNVPEGTLAQKGDRVLFVFAHPDDEMAVAGTIAMLHEEEIPISILCLTRGEAGQTGGLVPKEQLGAERTKELHEVKDILGVDELVMLNFPDSALKKIAPNRIKRAIKKQINSFEPTVIVGSDKTVGLYGHDDHQLAGLHLFDLLKAMNYSKLKSYYMVSLPQSMIDLALDISPTFKERYPKDPALGLPEANIAVEISAYGSVKRKAMEAHRTQRQVISTLR